MHQFLTHLATLLWKNFLIFRSNWWKYFLIYTSPIIVLLIMVIMQWWADANLQWVNAEPQIKQLASIPHCYGHGCLTLGYIINGERQPYMDPVIDHIKKANNLEDTDVQQLKWQVPKIMSELRSKPNQTQAIIVFCGKGGYWQLSNDIKITCQAEYYHLNFYTIIYNLTLYHRIPYLSSLTQPYPKDEVTIKLKYDIDYAIIKFYQPKAQINITTTSFASKSSRFISGISISQHNGSFFIMIPYLILLVLLSSELLKQKSKKLRIGLNIVGVTHFQYYCSELITTFLHVCIISCNFCLFGYLFDFKFWSKGLIWFNFYILITNGFIICLLAYCITALVTDKKTGMSIIYGFVLYSIIMQWIFTGGFILQLLYLDTANWIVRGIRIVFNLYPSFHFSKIYSDVNKKADSHLDTFQNRFVQGSQFTFNDLFVQMSQHYEKPFPHGYVLPSPFQSTIYLMLTSIIYLIILIIFDVFIESNRGYKQKMCCKRKIISDQISQNEQEKDEFIVRIRNLQKTYNSDTKVYALKGVSFDLKKGQIVSLLGENGAGKSTLINILIGALSMNQGQVRINGRNIEKQIKSIRKVMGVCPQFDILWEQLTAEEHIKMFMYLKGLQMTQKTIESSLLSVNLCKNKSGKVCTFSGGMRRRLSLAMSLLGQPKILILDQPTTGMDAQIRFNTWKLILSLRNKHTFLITTHNMEQAECLSDRIIIMSKGKVMVEGSTVDLKQQYGSGYIISGTDSNNQQHTLKCKHQELENTLTKMKQMKLQNWSIRQSTLQQVFLNVNEKM